MLLSVRSTVGASGRVASMLWRSMTCKMANLPTSGCLSVQVSCLALSKSGRYLASGQITYMGFTADIIIWDLESRQLLHRMALHKVRATAGHPEGQRCSCLTPEGQPYYPGQRCCCANLPAPSSPSWNIRGLPACCVINSVLP